MVDEIQPGMDKLKSKEVDQKKNIEEYEEIIIIAKKEITKVRTENKKKSFYSKRKHKCLIIKLEQLPLPPPSNKIATNKKMNKEKRKNKKKLTKPKSLKRKSSTGESLSEKDELDEEESVCHNLLH